jgi:hypothetical protein
MRSRHPIAASVPPQPSGDGCRAFGIELGEEVKSTVERVVFSRILQEHAVFGTSGRVQLPFYLRIPAGHLSKHHACIPAGHLSKHHACIPAGHLSKHHGVAQPFFASRRLGVGNAMVLESVAVKTRF